MKTNQQTVAIIDLGAGNLLSVHKAVERAARDGGLAAKVTVTTNAADIADADRIVLPGVGAFKACMDGLTGLPGMVDALEAAVLQHHKPLLGICVGMQMLASSGHEFGEMPGLGWITGEVQPLDAETLGKRVPHMGWNKVKATIEHELFGKRNELSGEDFYFLHSFHFETKMSANALAVCHYGAEIVAAIVKDNIIGVQFHPEKSQGAGLALLENFLRWQP